MPWLWSGRRNKRNGGKKRLAKSPWAALVGSVLLASLLNKPVDLADPVVSAQPPAPAPAPALAPPHVNPLDEPLQLLGAAARSYQTVQDYTCTLVKQERIKGQLQPEHIMLLRFRVQPFSVYMKWQGPKQMVGQEVCYVAGRNGGKMRVHAPGIIAGMLGFVSIDPNDPRVTEHSRHNITETGLGNLIQRFATDWERDRPKNTTHVSIAEYEFAGRRCSRIESSRLKHDPQAYCYRVVLYLDKQRGLPVRTECYDWPRQGGPQQGELLEVFSYLNLNFNQRLGDEHFRY